MSPVLTIKDIVAKPYTFYIRFTGFVFTDKDTIINTTDKDTVMSLTLQTKTLL